jgi:hypothetical protein
MSVQAVNALCLCMLVIMYTYMHMYAGILCIHTHICTCVSRAIYTFTHILSVLCENTTPHESLRNQHTWALRVALQYLLSCMHTYARIYDFCVVFVQSTRALESRQTRTCVPYSSMDAGSLSTTKRIHESKCVKPNEVPELLNDFTMHIKIKYDCVCRILQNKA